MSPPSIEPTAEQISQLASSSVEGPIAMLNLLRFRDQALEPDSGMSGAEAYGIYGQAVAPFLDTAGANVLSAVHCDQSVIGPAEPEWHMAVTVEYPSRQAFIAMVSDPAYQEIAVHRTAALADSRLVLSTKIA